MSGALRPQRSVDRFEWLAKRAEEPLESEQLIVDSHHHLYDRPDQRYLLDDYLADLHSGHDVRATVFVQARAMYRTSGPEEMRAVGETEYASEIATRSVSGGRHDVQVCAGIIGYADLKLGDRVRPVLEAHLGAGGGTEGEGGRFRGIRHIAAWDRDPATLNPAYPTTEDMLDSAQFRAGFAHLAPLNLSFDAWLYFHQIPRLTDLARHFPDVPIVLDHCGGILGVGRYDGQRGEVFTAWSGALRKLATCPNVMVKIGGLGMQLSGFGFERRPFPPSSRELSEAWRPWVETCIEIFGSRRCMFESNFPVDKASYSYVIGWNAMKRLTAGASSEQKEDLFWRSAARFYRLQVILQKSSELSLAAGRADLVADGLQRSL
jgi:L-fuconolactonase